MTKIYQLSNLGCGFTSVNYFCTLFLKLLSEKEKKSNTGTLGLANQMTVELKESHKELTEGAG